MPLPQTDIKSHVNHATKHEEEEEDVVLVSDGNGNMVDPSFITRKYLGVTYHKRNKKWIAQASENGRSKYLGCFKTPEKAAQMYDAYVVSQGGDNVKTNFPPSEIDPTLKPLVKRYRKRSRDVVMQDLQQIQSIGTDPWESYISGLASHCTKRRKKTRDPAAPKGPRNAYMMYIQKTRENLQKECEQTPLQEGNSFGAISRELGRRWKALDPTDKRQYEELAAADKIRYEQEKGEYDVKIENDNKRSQELLMTNMDVLQQQYNEYAQMQQQWLQMMGYAPTPAPAHQPPQNDASKFNYCDYNNLLQSYCTMSDQSVDMYKQLGYTPEELQTLQQSYFAALQNPQQYAGMNHPVAPMNSTPQPTNVGIRNINPCMNNMSSNITQTTTKTEMYPKQKKLIIKRPSSSSSAFTDGIDDSIEQKEFDN